jgi:hypothetical protein
VGFGAGDVIEALPGVFARLLRLRDQLLERRGREQTGRPAS